jgi:hypothetical protein
VVTAQHDCIGQLERARVLAFSQYPVIIGATSKFILDTTVGIHLRLVNKKTYSFVQWFVHSR